MYTTVGMCTVLLYILKYTLVVGAEAHEVRNEELRSNPHFLKFVPDVSKSQEMGINAVGAAPFLLTSGPGRCLKGLLKNIYTP